MCLRGYYISNQPLNTVSVQLRGNSWVMNPVMSGLTAHVDLSGFGEGWHAIRLAPRWPQAPARRHRGTAVPADHFSPSDPQYHALVRAAIETSERSGRTVAPRGLARRHVVI